MHGLFCYDVSGGRLSWSGSFQLDLHILPTESGLQSRNRNFPTFCSGTFSRFDAIKSGSADSLTAIYGKISGSSEQT